MWHFPLKSDHLHSPHVISLMKSNGTQTQVTRWPSFQLLGTALQWSIWKIQGERWKHIANNYITGAAIIIQWIIFPFACFETQPFISSPFPSPISMEAFPVQKNSHVEIVFSKSCLSSQVACFPWVPFSSPLAPALSLLLGKQELSIKWWLYNLFWQGKSEKGKLTFVSPLVCWQP